MPNLGQNFHILLTAVSQFSIQTASPKCPHVAQMVSA